jgi:hypothetical protein
MAAEEADEPVRSGLIQFALQKFFVLRKSIEAATSNWI